jgi:hypothetical protein
MTAVFPEHTKEKEPCDEVVAPAHNDRKSGSNPGLSLFILISYHFHLKMYCSCNLGLSISQVVE